MAGTMRGSQGLRLREEAETELGSGSQDENHTDAAVPNPVKAIIFKASSEHRRENRTLQLSS